MLTLRIQAERVRKMGEKKQITIVVQGYLDPARWEEWFGGLTLTLLESGDTQLTGPVADQAALHGILNRIRDLNLTLLSVTQLTIE